MTSPSDSPDSRVRAGSSERSPAERDRSDARLLDSWRRGDADAGDELLRRHFAMIYRFFASRFAAEATDLTQQTFAKAVESIEAVKELASFRAYLIVIAKNLLYSELRRRAGPRGQVDVLGTSQPARATSPSQAVVRRQTRAVVGRALRQLPLDLQLLLELHYWEGLTLGEAAQVFSIPEGTAKSRIHRALNLLRGHIDEISRNFRAADATSGANLDDWWLGLREIAGRTEPPA